jgi:hypothetical protein
MDTKVRVECMVTEGPGSGRKYFEALVSPEIIGKLQGDSSRKELNPWAAKYFPNASHVDVTGYEIIQNEETKTAEVFNKPKKERPDSSLPANENKNEIKPQSKTKKTSFWSPFWAIPFKLIWWLIRKILGGIF